MGLKIPAGNAVHISLFSRQQQLMIDKTVGAVAGAGVALRGGAGHSVGVALRGAHELSTGEGTTPLPPSPFLAPATFSASTCATSAAFERFFFL